MNDDSLSDAQNNLFKIMLAKTEKVTNVNVGITKSEGAKIDEAEMSNAVADMSNKSVFEIEIWNKAIEAAALIAQMMMQHIRQ